jgi:hypothetical protein
MDIGPWISTQSFFGGNTGQPVKFLPLFDLFAHREFIQPKPSCLYPK